MSKEFQDRGSSHLALFGDDEYLLSGYSSARGFRISIGPRPWRLRTYATSQHRAFPEKLRKVIGYGSLVITAVATMRWLNGADLFTWWRLIALSMLAGGILASCFTVLNVCSIFLSASIRRFHGAEHRLLALLSTSEPITREALAEMPSEIPSCGMTALIRSTIGLLSVNVVWVWTAFSVDPWYLTVIFAVGAVVLTALFAGKIAYPMSEWLQKHVTTATPSSTEIEQALELGQEIEAAHQHLMTPDMLHVRGEFCDRIWCGQSCISRAAVVDIRNLLETGVSVPDDLLLRAGDARLHVEGLQCISAGEWCHACEDLTPTGSTDSAR